jgi:hypothetical protein
LSNIDIVADASVEDETDEKQQQPRTHLSASIKKK